MYNRLARAGTGYLRPQWIIKTNRFMGQSGDQDNCILHHVKFNNSIILYGLAIRGDVQVPGLTINLIIIENY